MWNLKYDTSEFIYRTETLTDIETDGYQRGKGEGGIH